MNIEEIRAYCLSLPLASEDTPFGPEWLTFRVYGKIFACLDLTRPDRVVVKCAPDLAVQLRDRYRGVVGAWHWNKRYWNELLLDADLPADEVCRLIDHSLQEVLKKLSKKTQADYAAICAEPPR